MAVASFRVRVACEALERTFLFAGWHVKTVIGEGAFGGGPNAAVTDVLETHVVSLAGSSLTCLSPWGSFEKLSCVQG